MILLQLDLRWLNSFYMVGDILDSIVSVNQQYDSFVER